MIHKYRTKKNTDYDDFANLRYALHHNYPE